MPVYDYRCISCGNEFEKSQGMSEAPLTACPECGGAVKRLISGGSGFIMKKSAGPGPACGNSVPCCGRETPCGKSGECH